LQIHEFMTQPVFTVPSGATLHDALQLMWEHDIGALPVVDAGDRVVGMVTDRDVAMATYLHGQKPAALRVSETMSAGVRACRPGDSVASAEETMRTGQIRRLPVIDGDGRLLGMISLADLALHANEAAPASTANGLVRTLGAITKPRTDGSATPPV